MLVFLSLEIFPPDELVFWIGFFFCAQVLTIYLKHDFDKHFDLIVSI